MKQLLTCFAIFLIFIIVVAGCNKQPDYFTIGKQFNEVGDYENARGVLLKALEFAPKDALLRLELAKALAGMNERRSAHQQFYFAAKIGSKAVSDSFLTWGRKIIAEDPSENDARELFEYAVQANPQNWQAQFEKSRFVVRYGNDLSERQKALQNLKTAFEKISNNYVLDGTFEAVAKNRELLYRSFAAPVTLPGDGYEDYGPVAIYPDGKGMVWVRSYRFPDLQYQTRYFLCKKEFADTSFKSLTELNEWSAFPTLLKDTLRVVYSNSDAIYLYDLTGDSSKQVVKGIFPAVSPDDKKLAFVRDWDIYLANIDGSGEKRLFQSSERELWPRFSSDGTRVYFITQYQNYPWLAVLDTSGSNLIQLSPVNNRYYDVYNNPLSLAYDCRPDSEQIIMNISGTLHLWDAALNRLQSFNCRGRYPRFSEDGKFIIAIMDTPESSGELWRIDLAKFEAQNAILDTDKPNRNKIRKLLSQAVLPPEKHD